MKIKNSILFLCFLIFFESNSQDTTKTKIVSFGANFYHGFLWKHKKQASAIGSNVSDLQVIELVLEWQTKGKRGWHKNYNYPLWGVSTQFIHVNNPNYGHLGISALVYKSLRLIQSKPYKLKMKMGVGLGFFTVIYNLKTNPENKFITSPLSVAVNIGFENIFQITPKWQFVFTPSFLHFSNGATVMPNWGANIPSLAFGTRYLLRNENLKTLTSNALDKFTASKNYFHFSIAYGFLHDANDHYIYYSNYKFGLSYGRKVGKISKLIAGLDFIHSNSYIKVSRPAFLIDRVSIWIGHEFLFDRLGVVFGYGYYLIKPKELESKSYSRIGLRYHVSKNFFVGGFLRSHVNVADSMEWTLGFTL